MISWTTYRPIKTPHPLSLCGDFPPGEGGFYFTNHQDSNPERFDIPMVGFGGRGGSPDGYLKGMGTPPPGLVVE